MYQYDVFISYAHEDEKSAKKILKALREAKIKTWIDIEQLTPGQNWKNSVQKAIKKSRYFLALLSKKSVSKKGYSQKELKIALNLLDEFPESEVFIIPVYLEKCEPTHEKLREIHRVDLYLSWDIGLNKIIRAVKSTISEEIIWEGGWQRIYSGQFESANVMISNIENNSFTFEIIATSGSNTGEIFGIAPFIENQATFKREDCILTFELENEILRIDAFDCIDYGGIGVDFSGIYKSESRFQTITHSLTRSGIFLNKNQEDQFIKLVGSDYELFINSMHLIFEGDDLDNFKASVFYGAIRGLFTISESIIMYTETDDFWAATIDGNMVKYYTTMHSYGDNIPKTINMWRENFMDKKVLFMNNKS